MANIGPSDITPEHLYLSRRKVLTEIGALAAGALVVSACGRVNSLQGLPTAEPSAPVGSTSTAVEPSDQLTEFKSITNYNNFYEFSFDKEDVAERSRNFRTSPWSIEVAGLVNNPGTFDLDGLRGKFSEEERIYRLRCVEAWSMVIPWLGFPLSALLREVEPTSKAKYVRFETLFDPQQMPGEKDEMFIWPYAEGLRLDEAMHDLTLLGHGYLRQAPFASEWCAHQACGSLKIRV